MKKMCRRIGAGALVVTFVLATGFAGAADVGATIQSVCSKCHSTKRICLNVGAKDRAGWEATVKAMVAKGARLSPADIGPAADYLSGLAPGTGTVCQ